MGAQILIVMGQHILQAGSHLRHEVTAHFLGKFLDGGEVHG